MAQLMIDVLHGFQSIGFLFVLSLGSCREILSTGTANLAKKGEKDGGLCEEFLRI